jgi:hypothetical protein
MSTCDTWHVTRLMTALRTSVTAAALIVVHVACTGNDGAQNDAPWGTEAVSFFEELTVEHSDNDFYGVLDFYTPSAYIEKWRGDIQGGAQVAEFLRWNSGDLDQEILGVYLSSQGALTMVSWDATNEMGAVVSTIQGGLIEGETVFDLAGPLTRSLRASPGVVATYEGLYTTYATAWSGGDVDKLRSLYASWAVINDPLNGLVIDGIDSVTASGAPGKGVSPYSGWDTSEAFSTVFLGPVAYGQDPGRAVGVFDVTDASGCVHRMATVWVLEGGLIISEDRYHDVATYPDCHSPTPEGWWTGLARPSPSDEVTTGVLHTPAGREVQVHNGTPLLERVLQDAMARYDAAGIPEPKFDTVTFEPSRECVGRSGRLIQSEGRRNLFICLFESDLCPAAGECQEPTLAVRGIILHELAHAWTLDHVDDDLQSRFLQLVGLDEWHSDADLPWAEQGVEYSADVMAWGLLDKPARMARIGNPGCQDLTDAFRLLTGAEPLQECGA